MRDECDSVVCDTGSWFGFRKAHNMEEENKMFKIILWFVAAGVIAVVMLLIILHPTHLPERPNTTAQPVLNHPDPCDPRVAENLTSEELDQRILFCNLLEE